MSDALIQTRQSTQKDEAQLMRQGAELRDRLSQSRLTDMGPQNRRMLGLAASFLDGAAAVFGFPT